MFTFIPLAYYTKIYYWVMFLICLTIGATYTSSTGCNRLLKQNPPYDAFLLVLVLTLYMGLRPISGKYFGDMSMYAHYFRVFTTSSYGGSFNLHTEWFYDFSILFVKSIVNDVNIWFLMISTIYFGCQLLACQKLLYENVLLAMLFILFTISFWPYGVNGIRNGMGCAIMMLAIAFACDRNMASYAVCGFLCLIAIGTHRSEMIPIAALLASLFVVKDIKMAVYIWIMCIGLSVVAGGWFQGFFANLGFDERMSSYSSADTSQFSHTGFRWDFLLYSAMPIWLAWHIDKKGARDQTFTLLANTYIIANAFWVLVCRAPYSNRFAYLSWFLYALVLAYGVIRVPFDRNQDRFAGMVLIAHSAFTIFMFTMGR